MTIFVFDIETIPDVTLGRKLYGLRDLSDTEVAEAMLQLRRQKTGHDFLPHHQQKIVAISVVLENTQKQCKVWSLGTPESDEKELLQRFFDGIEKYKPMLVSWNGGGFDLPVIHYRALHHGVSSPTYWKYDEDFKFNNYLNRFHYRHTDLMDVLAGYQARANISLHDAAKLLGFPGKMDMDGEQVWETYQRGDLEHIRNYCETDVLNTYLVFLRFELIRENLSHEQYEHTIHQLRTELLNTEKPHLITFVKAWNHDEKNT